MVNGEHDVLSNDSMSTTTTTTATATTFQSRLIDPRRIYGHHHLRSGLQFDTYRNSKKNAFAWTNRLNISSTLYVRIFRTNVILLVMFWLC